MGYHLFSINAKMATKISNFVGTTWKYKLQQTFQMSIAKLKLTCVLF